MTTAEELLNIIQPGDMVQFDRGVYQHWAIYIGNGYVIHLAADDGDMGGASDIKVRKDSLKKVANGDPVSVENNKDYKWRPYSPEEIVARAKSRLGKVGYNIVLYNCEHFTNWCRYGKTQSDQVDNVAAMGARYLGPRGHVVLQAYDFFKDIVGQK